MSRITELVAREADDVEAELGTENPERDPLRPEPEPEPEPEQVAAAPTDADLKRFEREVARHEKELGKIMGADFEHFTACAQCDGVGFVPEQSNEALPFEHDPQRETCDQCKGYGTTLTGAREPGMVTMACSRCQGAGWTTKAEHPEIQPLAIAYDSTTTASDNPPANGGAVDPRVAALQAEGFVVVDARMPAPAPGS